ncbi:acyltransferase family protein [Dysgonomonas macrotermitis]|uniref:Peptidoglycan/LPS O-acetylase OafA/YrhL, contains acyltransferase and SGNH-hydrolase domains n=1 Tax=Dysgonomonas macrotermitis TaxID=1346286 RepID=A0A1M5IFJ4_9BACT|nr:acyltransferase [Dysgonomonas macrotermitis]SHG27027.1 Peptidoglycan/LPS O-acetylase OafA/YrhL, contains acyltransferase and SGNH-hydrolase domains [Dysgonomonas macrotermitis]
MNENQQGLYTNITYFKGLNTLRFFAAYLVVIHHSESMKLKNAIGSLGSLSLLQNGGNAVTFFFVLSGFLITYILLKERKNTETVKVKNFYRKRVLRIWPLYFLLVFLGAVIIPFLIQQFQIDYKVPYTLSEVWLYFLLFFPGLVTFYYGHHMLEPLWSIGVEEVFYLIWAPLFKFIRKNILGLLIGVIVVKALLSIIPFFIDMPDLYTFLVNMLKFEAMAVGGLGAYFIFRAKRNLNTLYCYKKPVQVIVYLILFIFIIFDTNILYPFWDVVFETPVLSPLIVNFLFLYLIVGVSMISGNIIKLENKFFSYLGEISYGIYMYHITVISAVILLLKKLPVSFGFYPRNILFYVLVTVGTILVAHLSKKYFENYFLRMKK